MENLWTLPFGGVKKKGDTSGDSSQMRGSRLFKSPAGFASRFGS